jgi:lipopolysaccharide transport system ATP-binding protein
MLLENGRIGEVGRTDRTIQSYLSVPSERARVPFPAKSDAPSITAVSVDPRALQLGTLSVFIEYSSPYPLRRPIGGIVVSSTTGVPIWGSNGRFHANEGDDVSSNAGILVCECTMMPLVPSIYTLSAWLGDWYQDFDEKRDVLSFDFRPDAHMPARPSATAVGHLDWPANWKSRTRVAGDKSDIPQLELINPRLG